MLVLSRKVGERILVGENITIEVRRVAGNRVTLALDAPRSVRILRGELEGPAREFDAPAESKPAEPETHREETPYLVSHGMPTELLHRDAVV